MANSELLHIFSTNNLWQDTLYLERHTFIKLPDNVDPYIYLIHSGSVKIGYYTDNGEELVRLGYEGDIVLDLESYLTNQPSNLFIQTIKATTVQRAKKSDFIEVINQSAHNLKIYNVVLEQLLLDMLIREKDLLLLSPKERYTRFLKRSPHALKHIPRKYIAQYLRMTPETLSRLVNY